MAEPRPDHLLNHIDGSWVSSSTGAVRANLNPANTDDAIGDFAESGAKDAASAVDAAASAQGAWDALGPIERATFLTAAARLIDERREEFAEAITREQGKRLSEGRGEVSRSLAILDFAIGEARRINGVTTPAEEPRTIAMTFRRPLGVVGLITPWNFPVAIPMWKVAPALIAGCTAVLKPSPLTPWTSSLLVQAFTDAGLPPGVLNLVQGDRDPGEALVADARVAGISFTGSLPVGRAINRAGADRLMRTQLELGGKNALIVLADADLDAAVEAIVHGAFGQSGQRCSATSRVIVDRSVRETLLERLLPRVRAMRIGRGDQDWADIGPVVNEARMRACLDAVASAVAAGATAVCGGRAAELGTPGYFVEPTVLTDVARDSEIAQEEVFGPVLSVIDCDGYEDAMRISNSVKYGMSGTIFTQNPSLMFQALQDFQAGMLHVNRPGVGAYSHLPHMGAKASQLGAPECSPDVWNFYTDLRSACIRY
ncbi:aldehyde dehydrogenase family protein [Streptomyces sp. NPDC050529]|uniref:aldehyde dehydrogenase family protein n=1 Tax=unclassified Streptomyces TaxID=2593676 RepID=UPI002DD7C0C8|nr:aldehyde dehydrogenase family protein [Streptomyces sp. NBC_01022]WRZ79270.1 aldehyde dehydrogenase family protein [Streptomyces sp. NBC_01022]WRZ86406.1 aldehyde dehydrogenase family protein [Streptomyces sp. NBC_01022]